jgi:type IV secretion system protein VirB4
MTALQGLLQNEALKAALTRYTLKGPMGRYLDADRDELLDSRLITSELETLQNNQALEPVLLYLFHRIEQRLDGRPTFISLDEAAWVLLTEGVFGDQLEEWLINLRKRNAVVWLWSQSLDHVYRSRHRAIILQGCPSRIFLHDPDAETPNMAEVYRSFGLADAEIRIIARELVPKRTYLLITPNGSTVLDLELDPVTLSFVGAGSPEDIRRIRELSAQHGEHWPAWWLRERGLPEAAAEFERLASGYSSEQLTAAAD